MKIAFYILAILACGGAAYFSFDHSAKFEHQQSVRLETISTNKNVVANADVTDNEITKQEDVLAKAKERRDTFEATVSSLKSQGSTLQNEINELENTLKTQTEELTELEKAIEEVRTIVAGLGGDVTIETLPDHIKGLQEQHEERQAKVAELETLIAGAEKSITDKRAELGRIAQRKIARNNRIRANSMEAVVTAVDQDWGFLVIGAGANSGFTPQTDLLIQRDGRLIGRVTPSAIEPTQTIAEIDLKTLSPGARIQPGDRVILASPSAN